MSDKLNTLASTTPNPTAPDAAGLFQKAGVPYERAEDLLDRYADKIDIIARHASSIV